MSSSRRMNYPMPWRTQHPKRHFPTSANPKWLQLRNSPRYFPRWQIIFRKEQTLQNSKQWKIRHFTSESASRYDKTSSLSTAQYHRRWWGDVLYKFSAQVPHVPFRSKHYSPGSPCPTTKGTYCATYKGGQGRAKLQIEIKRQLKTHSTLCIDRTIPKTMNPIQLPIKSLGWPSNIDIWSNSQRGKFGKDPLQTNWGN